MKGKNGRLIRSTCYLSAPVVNKTLNFKIGGYRKGQIKD